MNWVHIHLATNHLPVVGLPLLLLILGLGAWRRQAVVVQLALGLLTLLSMAAIAVKFTGDFAVPQLPPSFTSLKDLVNHHEAHGDQATTAVFGLGLLTGIAWIRCRPGRPAPTWLLALILLVGVVTCGLYLRTAGSGGEISHPEIRPKALAASPAASNVAKRLAVVLYRFSSRTC